MGSNKYSIILFVYLVILSVLGFGFFWSFSSSQLIITKFVIGILFIIFFLFLLRYLNKTNRELVKFLEAIKYQENIASGKKSGLSFEQLELTYREITNQLKKSKLAKESEHQYFKYTLENIEVGIISFDESGKVEIINNAAKSILGIHTLNHIDGLNTELAQIGEDLKDLEPGKSKLLKINTAIDQSHVLVKLKSIKIGERKVKVLSLQDIKTQLEESELEAWQKLIKVLTHEIMNSVTPIKSLTYSMQKSLKSKGNLSDENKSLLKGLNAIEKRSKGLLDFVESYKNLTQVKKPVYERVNITALFDSVNNLMNNELEANNVEIIKNVKPDEISVIADEMLITQVLVNLILNSIKALMGAENKLIELIAYKSEDKVKIEIRDNGKGINKDTMDQIFVPFFSTYEDGSGIGLSFTRQVMVLHNGRVEANSLEGEGATFKLTF